MARVTISFKCGGIGEVYAYYKVEYHNQSEYVFSGLSFTLETPHGNFPPLLSQIESCIRHQLMSGAKCLRHLLSEAEIGGELIHVRELADKFERYFGRWSILAYGKMLIEKMRLSNRYGSAYNYTRALSSFARFMQGKDLPIFMLNDELIGKYEVYLKSRGVTRNTVSFYMRNLRCVYNKAVSDGHALQEHPFANVYTGVDKTRKRAVGEEVIIRLRTLRLPPRSPLALARDMFIFSYCMRGMAFVDIAYLRKENLHGEVIIYTRRKTGQTLCVKLCSLAKSILKRYASRKSEYLFPVITSSEPLTAYGQYRQAVNEYNRQLSKLSHLLPGDVKLTSYTARHSWATIARRVHGVDISVVSAALGHTTEQTTRIYLAELESSVIDEANAKLTAALDKSL